MPTLFVLLLLLLAAASNATNHTTSNASTSTAPYAEFLSCCPNFTKAAAVCLDPGFNTSAPYAIHSQFSFVARGDLGECANVSALNQTHNAHIGRANSSAANVSAAAACAPALKNLACSNSTIMNEVCVPVNQSGAYWTCNESPVMSFFNLSKCIEAFQQNNISTTSSPISAEKSLSAFFSNSFSQVAGLEQSGSNALNISWISFLIASVLLAFFSRSRVCPDKSERHVLRVLIAVNIFAMVAYLVMSAGEGRVKIYRVQINEQSTTFSMLLVTQPQQHQWYARHLLWIITTPGLLYALWFMGGSMTEYFVLAIAFSEIMLVCGLVATLLAESPAARWLLLIYGIFFFCIVIYLLIRRFISEDKAVSQLKKTKEHMRSSFTIAANYTVIVWLMYGSTLPPVYYCNTLCMYPIFWILGDGLDQLDDNSSVIAFSVLDMASKIGFSAIFFRACKKSPNWHKAIVSFSRQKSAHPPSAPIQSQLPPEPAPAASEATAVAPADSAVEFRSPNPRKAKGR